MTRDIIHNAVKNALIKDGWQITHDPYTIQYDDERVMIDLGAERLLAAERKGQKIAVEIKSFVGHSNLHDMEVAIGQYVTYLSFLEIVEPDRKLYLAISDLTYESIFQRRKTIQFLMERNQIPLIIVNVSDEELMKWIR